MTVMGNSTCCGIPAAAWSISRGTLMNFWRFWNDLSVLNKFGLAFVTVVIVLTLILVLT